MDDQGIGKRASIPFLYKKIPDKSGRVESLGSVRRRNQKWLS